MYFMSMHNKHVWVIFDRKLFKLQGANSYGQLGIGNNDDQTSPVAKMWSDGDVVKVTGGGGHTFFSLCKPTIILLFIRC